MAYLTGDAYGYRLGLQIVLRADAVDLIWFEGGRLVPYSFETYSTTSWELLSAFPDVRSSLGRRRCTLMVTRNCNLHCTYCYESYKCADKTKEMPFEMAKNLILQEAEMVSKSQTYKELAIDFMGGEPLMNFPLIKRIVEWLEKKPLPVPFVCHATTNGTLVKRHEDWLRKHASVFKLGGSYDGTPESQRLNRGTGESFERNIHLLHEIYPELGFHMVISKESLPHLAEGVLTVQRQGYKIKAAIAQGIDWSENDANIFRQQLEILARAYLGQDKRLTPLNLLTRPLILVADDPETVQQEKWCGSGTNMVAYDYDGGAYGCHMFTPVVLGDKAREAKDINYTCKQSVEDPRCHKCHLKGVCPTCAGFNYRYRGSPAMRDLSWCKMIIAQMRIACIFQIKALSRLKHHTEHEKLLAKCAYEAWDVLKLPDSSVLGKHCH